MKNLIAGKKIGAGIFFTSFPTLANTVLVQSYYIFLTMRYDKGT